MSLFAGVIAVDPGARLPPGAEHILRSQLSRKAEDTVCLHQGPHHCIAHVELGLLPGKGHVEDPCGGLSMLCGDPLIPDASVSGGVVNRQEALRRLRREWIEGRDALLRGTRGDFCALHFDQNTLKVRLCTDRLGLRPLYHASVHGCLVFANSLRMVLLLVPELGLRPDLRGQLQVTSFGYCLGDRTPFEGIRLLRPAHVWDVAPGSAQTRPYFRWSDPPCPGADAEDRLEQLQRVFAEGVRLRLGSQQAVIAQLSGGLDSRCVVAGLREQGAQVHSVNFSPPGSADLVLGRLAAQALGTLHLEVTDGPASLKDRSVHAHQRLLSHLGDGSGVECTRAIWSGFGGDSVLSQTELSPTLIQALEAGDLDRAIALYLPLLKVAFPARIFQPGVRAELARSLQESVRHELQATGERDLMRAFNVFQATERLRGPLRSRYEERDIRRLEYVTPLCDPDFVACALTLPVRDMVGHRLYYRWLETFRLPVARIAWQAYPGCDPCPVPLPDGLRNQWSDGWFSPEAMAEHRRIDRRRQAQELRAPYFPANILSRRNLWMAFWLCRVGAHRYQYLLQSAMPIIGFAAMAAQADDPARQGRSAMRGATD